MQAAAVLRFILRRLAIAIPLLLIVSFGVFALVHLAPGDPVRALLGSRASDPATLAAIRERYHLNDPFIVQYGKWLWQVLQGDLGRSIQGSQLVTSAIRQRLGLTIFLGLMSSFLVLFFGILLGMLAGFRRGTRLDRGVVMFGVFGISSPAFVTGILLLYLFGVVLGWFPIFGAGRGFLDRFWHLTLPAVALALSIMAIVVKITRAAVIQELDKDYVVFARARGLSPLRIVFGYVLRNALIPVVTAAGLIIVGLVANAIYVEVTFALPGLGSLTVEAVQRRDIPLIQGTTLVFSAFVILLNLLIDLAYTLIDPRIRFGTGAVMTPAAGAPEAGAGRRGTAPHPRHHPAGHAADCDRGRLRPLRRGDRAGFTRHAAPARRRQAALGGLPGGDRSARPRRALPRHPWRLDRAGGSHRDRRRRLLHRHLARPSLGLSRRAGRFGDHALGRFHVRPARAAGGHRRGRRRRRRLLDRGARADRPLHRPRYPHRAQRGAGAAAAALYRRRPLARHLARRASCSSISCPMCCRIVLAYVLLDFAFALVNLAGLSFLGLGVQPGTPDWGRMLFENRNILFSNPVALLLPAAMIILTAVSMNLIGDWLFERCAK